jgi:hypothetical protein
MVCIPLLVNSHYKSSSPPTISYKTYLKGKLSSQLLCRISIPELGKEHDMNTNSLDFWKILGIHDEFDIRYIISEVERFCSLYSIRNSLVDTSILDEAGLDVTTAGLTVSPLHNFLGPGLDVSVSYSDDFIFIFIGKFVLY